MRKTLPRKILLFGQLIGFCLLLSAPSVGAQMSHDTSPSMPQFRQIEQPTGLKVGVTLSGLALIGLELWWFLYSKKRSQTADTTREGIQEIAITVDGGYEPSQVIVKVGQPVRLNFFRRDPSSCLEQVRFPDFHIAQDLKLNQITPIEFTPQIPGEYSFTCGMNMFRGTLEVQASESADLVTV
jgi:plastocyanin domain-containing protein